MSFLPVIPSQRSAASYVSGVASGTTGPLFLGGHSKGGHLAEFAALDADQPVYERIFSVYNHDGPSFAEDPSPRMRTDEYACKLHKTVPVDSLFGMVYEDRESFCVVDAESFSVFQHNPFSWIVEEGRFKHLEDLSTGAMLIDDVFSNWSSSGLWRRRSSCFARPRLVPGLSSNRSLSRISPLWWGRAAVSIPTRSVSCWGRLLPLGMLRGESWLAGCSLLENF